jgi:hypothetical protein
MRYGPVAREMAARHHHVSCEERDNDAGAKVVAEPAILHLPRSNGPAAAVLHLLRGGVEVGRAGLRALSPLPLPLVLGHGWIMTMVASWWGGDTAVPCGLVSSCPLSAGWRRTAGDVHCAACCRRWQIIWRAWITHRMPSMRKWWRVVPSPRVNFGL